MVQLDHAISLFKIKKYTLNYAFAFCGLFQ